MILLIPGYLFCAPEEEGTLKKMLSNQINLNCLFLIVFVICSSFKQSKAPHRNREDQETSNINRWQHIYDSTGLTRSQATHVKVHIVLDQALTSNSSRDLQDSSEPDLFPSRAHAEITQLRDFVLKFKKGT